MLPRWSIGIFSISQRALALTFRRISPKDCCYMDAALRREKGRLCFIIGKGNSFVSKWSRFFEENVSSVPFISTHCKKLVDFSSKPPHFLAFSLSFLGKGERFFLRYALSYPAHRHALSRTRACASRTQRVLNLCLHPSPLPLTRCILVVYE